MKDIKADVKHSQSKAAWNVVGLETGGLYKIARVSYPVFGDEISDAIEKSDALERALFISKCLNNAERISELF